jgi:hypothetical protein
VVDATPERLSLGVSVRLTAPLTQLFELPLIPVLGAVLSIFTGALVAVVVLPAMSVRERVTVRFSPSLLIVSSPGQAPAARPEPLSLQLQRIVTLPLYQPLLPLGPEVGAPDRFGGVVSLADAVREVEVVLPALSVAVPVTVTPPATVRLLSADPLARQVAIPERSLPPGSSQVKEMVLVPSGFCVSDDVMLGRPCRSTRWWSRCRRCRAGQWPWRS